MRRTMSVVTGVVGVFLGACSDAPTPIGPGRVALQESEGRGFFQRYVSIGTSISMGWRSDGVVAASQSTSWPAQLARLANREMTQPYITGFGCRSPLVAPLRLGTRTSGEAAGASAGSFACAGLEPGITLPTQNVAVSSARTRHALFMTPSDNTDAFYSKLYPLVLPQGETQVTAAISQNPKFLSIELGGNDVLDARSGMAIPGATITPYAEWQPLYDELLDRVGVDTKEGVLVGLVDDVGTFPGMRRGSELYDDRGAFLAAFNVAVSADCNGSPNLLFVPVRIPTVIVAGLTRRAQQLGPADLFCTAGGFGQPDFVLDPSEIAVVNNLLAQMNAHIRDQATQRGWAHFELEALYGRSDIKGTFSSVALMTSQEPYGPYIGLDGIHPSAEGARILAEAAAAAINARYDLGIPTSTPSFLAAR